MFRYVLKVALILAFVMGPWANTQAAPKTSRVMFMTSSYGVMIGTLAGIATLAFYDSPSGHSRNVALGASLGLYSGILLGVYIIYLKDSDSSSSYDEEALIRPRAPVEAQLLMSDLRNPLVGPNDILISPIVSFVPATGLPTFGLSANF